MAQYNRRTFIAKSGSEIVIRSAKAEDAQSVLILSRSVLEEEIYQMTSASEFKMTKEDEEKWIASNEIDPNKLILVAEVDSMIVGILDFSNGRRKRISHTGEFGMSVQKRVREQGIGRMLLTALLDWAERNETIEKIGLNVHANNDRAIALYKKMGFAVEGVRKRDLKYGENQYVDTIVMGLFV